MMPILKVENLSKDFVKSLDLVAKGLNKIGQNYKEEIVHAVDNVNFSIFKGENRFLLTRTSKLHYQLFQYLALSSSYSAYGNGFIFFILAFSFNK